MRVLLVEDETDLGTAIKRVLSQTYYVVDWVKHGLEAWNHLESDWIQYGVGVFDWMLPGLSGVDLVKRLREQHSHLPVLLLSAKDSIEDRVTGLDAGADDYLVKPFGMIELLARLRALQRRAPEIQPQQLKTGNLTLDYATNSFWWSDDRGQTQKISLTGKEFLLLEYFMRHPEHIVTSDRLLNQVWEANLEPNSNVVAAQIRLLRRKLKHLECQVAIETVYGLGYRFLPTVTK